MAATPAPLADTGTLTQALALLGTVTDAGDAPPELAALHLKPRGLRRVAASAGSDQSAGAGLAGLGVELFSQHRALLPSLGPSRGQEKTRRAASWPRAGVLFRVKATQPSVCVCGRSDGR